MKKLVLIIFAIGFIFYACGSESTEDKEITSAGPNGEKLYQKTCASCHGVLGDSGFAGAANLKDPEITLEQRIETITNGSQKNATMIAYKDQFSEREIKAIAEYTMSFVEK